MKVPQLFVQQNQVKITACHEARGRISILSEMMSIVTRSLPAGNFIAFTNNYLVRRHTRLCYGETIRFLRSKTNLKEINK